MALYKGLMGEPHHLTPRQIDELTLAQAYLYFRDVEAERRISVEEAYEHVMEVRRKRGMD